MKKTKNGGIIILDKNEKFLSKIKIIDKSYISCFKQGKYYVIFENMRFEKNRYDNNINLGQKLWNHFPGKILKS